VDSPYEKRTRRGKLYKKHNGKQYWTNSTKQIPKMNITTY
jgi:hypothetical protein